MNIYIIIGIILTIVIITTITIILIVTGHTSEQESDTNMGKDEEPTQEPSQQSSIQSSNNKTTDKNTSDASGNSVVSTKPLYVNIVSGENNPNIVKNYDNDSDITDIKVKEKVDKQSVINKNKINNKNLSSNITGGQNSTQIGISNFP